MDSLNTGENVFVNCVLSYQPEKLCILIYQLNIKIKNKPSPF